MNTLVNKSFKFACERFEEWENGNCTSKGPLNALITVDVQGNEVNVLLEGIDNISIKKQVTFSTIGGLGMSVDLGDRLQYVNPNFTVMDSENPVVFHVFYNGVKINCLRFAMILPERIIEFYGNVISFDGMDKRSFNNGRLPSFKKDFIDDLADQYRKLLKENTVSLAIIDHQFACVAFSLKKYNSLKAMYNNAEDALKTQIFKDTSSIISEFYPIFGNTALDIASSWYDQLLATTHYTESFLNYYYSQLDQGNSIDAHKIQQTFSLR
jgi:hypothetical protein